MSPVEFSVVDWCGSTENRSMKILDWLHGAAAAFMRGLRSLVNQEAGPDRGSSDGPPDNMAPVPRRPIAPVRSASTAQRIPEPERELCER